jgi:hypothetical protein
VVAGDIDDLKLRPGQVELGSYGWRYGYSLKQLSENRNEAKMVQCQDWRRITDNYDQCQIPNCLNARKSDSTSSIVGR